MRIVYKRPWGAALRWPYMLAFWRRSLEVELPTLPPGPTCRCYHCRRARAFR